MDLTVFLIVLVGWIFSLCLHEFSHALVAYYGGDTSVREKGYLTFNPLKYTHPVYSIVMPLIFLALGGIGLPGGAVYIETWRIRDRKWLSAVSLAGPSANLLVAFILGVLLSFTPLGQASIAPALSFLAYLQVTAVVFNLIPLPPLDGFGILAPYLNPSLAGDHCPPRRLGHPDHFRPDVAGPTDRRYLRDHHAIHYFNTGHPPSADCHGVQPILLLEVDTQKSAEQLIKSDIMTEIIRHMTAIFRQQGFGHD